MQNFLWLNLHEVQKLAKLVIKVRRVEAFREEVMVIKTGSDAGNVLFLNLGVSYMGESISLKTINLCLVICLH